MLVAISCLQAILDSVGLSPTKKTVLNILHNINGVIKPARLVSLSILSPSILPEPYDLSTGIDVQQSLIILRVKAGLLSIR